MKLGLHRWYAKSDRCTVCGAPESFPLCHEHGGVIHNVVVEKHEAKLDAQVEAARAGVVERLMENGAQDTRTWTTDELQEAFEIEGFGGGLCVVRFKSDGQRGSLDFTSGYPRFYHSFVPHKEDKKS